MPADSDDEQWIQELRGRSPGVDAEDPYEDVDLTDLPNWWQDAVREFERHGLRPYRPPRFADGELKHEVVSEIERELAVTVDFVGYEARYGNDWTVLVDREPIGNISRRRDTAGYTVFEMDSERFADWVRAEVQSR